LDSGCVCGGICKLRELIEEHPAEVAYDFRSRFNITLDAIGVTVTWREAILLTSVLVRDPSSWICAAWSGWQYPVSREWIALAHTFDLHTAVNSRKGSKPKPYPNPFPKTSGERVGKTNKSFAEVRRILDWMNPKE
jgi:hypothetical protein